MKLKNKEKKTVELAVKSITRSDANCEKEKVENKIEKSPMGFKKILHKN